MTNRSESRAKGPTRVAWTPDTSPRNLSSIGLWLRRVGNGQDLGSVVLTGDGMHDRIVDEMEQIVGKHGNPTENMTVFQIPHHGGFRNTNVKESRLPRDVMNPGGKVTFAFASGGESTVTDKAKKGPRIEVIAFHKRGAHRVLVVRERMRGKGHLDIELTR